MIGLTEVIAAVSGMIEEVFNAPPATKDRVEGIPRQWREQVAAHAEIARIARKIPWLPTR